MKKKCTFFIAVLVMLFVSISSFAQSTYPYTDFRTLEINTTTDWITIDGKADEAVWAQVVEQPIDKILHNIGQDPVVNTWGFAATFKAVRDANYFYMFIKVIDNTWVPWIEGAGETNVDNVEIFFYPNPDERSLVYPSGGAPDDRPRGLSQVRASVGNNLNRATGGGYVMGFKTGTTADPTLPEYEYKIVQTANGYNLELVIPWDILISNAYEGNLAVGKKILFDVNVANCTTPTSGRDIILGWSSDDFGDWKYNAKLGEMVFNGPFSSVKNEKINSINRTLINDELVFQNLDLNTNVNIYNVFGQEVKSVNYSGNAINLANLSTGIYIVNLNNIGSFKLVK